MIENDFVIDSEKVIKILEQMALRGIQHPVQPKYEWSTEEIVVNSEERKQIQLYCLHHRQILSRSGIKPIEGLSGEQTHTFSTSVKLSCAIQDRTSVSYCNTLMEEIEETVGKYIRNTITERNIQ